MGDPWGTPQTSSLGLVTPPWNRTCTLRHSRNDEVHRSNDLGHPWACIRHISLLCKTASKAPCTSSVTNVEAQPCVLASSMSCTTHETRSFDDLLGSAPNCWRPTISQTIESCDILFAKILSKPFPRQDRSDIGLHPFTDEGSRPFFGRKTISASLKHCGW